jgi:hypothetical protein
MFFEALEVATTIRQILQVNLDNELQSIKNILISRLIFNPAINLNRSPIVYA